MAKENCWEHMRCGCEPGGAKAKERGLCPAATERKLNGVHGGINAGRSCWIVARTLRDGQDQGDFTQKVRICAKCDFYRSVRKEEGLNLRLAGELMKKLKE